MRPARRRPSALRPGLRAVVWCGWRVARGLCAATVLLGLVAGLPWALVCFIGWPLPDHWPSLEELGAVLMTPMPAGFVLDACACLAWILWLVFTVDVIAGTAEVARGARWPELQRHAGPVRRMVAVLIAALLVAVLGRAALASPMPPRTGPTPIGYTPVVATAPTAPVPSRDPVGTVRVQPPKNGIHDSLWRIAQRHLGNGDRWPEIWALNHGSTQPGGRVLTNPNRIHPGDTLQLPVHQPTIPATNHVPSPHIALSTAPPDPASPEASRAPVPARPSHAPVTTGQHQDRGFPQQPVGSMAWGSEVFVGLGLAAALSAAVLLVRRRRHARYRPGSGARDDDVPLPPVVYQLHHAHQRARGHDEDTTLLAEASDTCEDHTETDPIVRSELRAETGGPEQVSVQVLPPGQRRVVAERGLVGQQGSTSAAALTPELALQGPESSAGSSTTGARALALDLAGSRGLGLIGPGGHAAARAILVGALSTRSTPGVTVLVPQPDLTRLLGIPTRTEALPHAIHLVDDLDTALAELECHLLSQGDNRGDAPDDGAPQRRPRMLVTRPPTEEAVQARLQGVLDNGGQSGITALLLGQWRPGITAYVTAAGVISATSPGRGEQLRGARAFTLPDTATRDLLILLRAADPGRSSAPTGHDATHDGRPASQSVPSPSSPPPSLEAPRSPTGAPEGQHGLEITRTTPEAEHNRDARTAPDTLPTTASSSQTADTAAPLVLTAFGTPTVSWRPTPTYPERLRDISHGFSARPTELLTFLAVHPDGVTREAIIDALWPEQPPQRPGNVLRTVLSRIRSGLRRTLDEQAAAEADGLVRHEHGRYRLDPALVEVDYWSFADAVAQRRRASTSEERITADKAIVTHYGGALADGLHADWLIVTREATRRDALDAVAALARAQVHTDPDYTLELLETARSFDPHNELLYRDIMRLQANLGRHDAISRTLSLLETRLTELDTTPTPETLELARRLHQRHTGITGTDDTAMGTHATPQRR